MGHHGGHAALGLRHAHRVVHELAVHRPGGARILRGPRQRSAQRPQLDHQQRAARPGPGHVHQGVGGIGRELGEHGAGARAGNGLGRVAVQGAEIGRADRAAAVDQRVAQLRRAGASAPRPRPPGRRTPRSRPRSAGREAARARRAAAGGGGGAPRRSSRPARRRPTRDRPESPRGPAPPARPPSRRTPRGAGTRSNSRAVTTPKLPPPPRRAQKRSGSGPGRRARARRRR